MDWRQSWLRREPFSPVHSLTRVRQITGKGYCTEVTRQIFPMTRIDNDKQEHE